MYILVKSCPDFISICLLLRSLFTYPPFSDAALWLVVAGAISMADASLKIYARFTKTKVDDAVVKKASPGLSLGFFCVVIWGSIQVFGKNFYFYFEKFFTNYCLTYIIIFFFKINYYYVQKWALVSRNHRGRERNMP